MRSRPDRRRPRIRPLAWAALVCSSFLARCDRPADTASWAGDEPFRAAWLRLDQDADGAVATRELAARWWGLPAPVDSDSDGLVSLAEFAAAMLRQDPLALDGAAGTRPAGLGGAASDAAAADRIWELLLVLREEVDPLGTRRDLPDMERLRRAAAAGTLADRDVYDCLDGLAAAWRAQGLDFPVALSRAALAPPAPDPAYPPPPGAQPPPP